MVEPTRRPCRIVALAALLGGVTSLATPAAANSGLVVEAVIAGVSQTCEDFRGIPVHTMEMDDLGDVARTWIVSRMPVIAIDPQRMGRLPAKLQLFFFQHECAHHALGHNFAPTMWSENEADCWAVKRGRDKGLFTRDDVAAFAPYFANSKGTAVGHLPGPERAARLLVCFDDDTDELVNPQARNPEIRSASLGG